MKHDYKADCQCYRCKGIRNDPCQRKVIRTAAQYQAANRKLAAQKASREEQHGRYIDCGPLNWDS